MSDDDEEEGGARGRGTKGDEHRISTFDTSESDSDEDETLGRAGGGGGQEERGGGGSGGFGGGRIGEGGSAWQAVGKLCLAFALSLALTTLVLRLLASTSTAVSTNSFSSAIAANPSLHAVCPACPTCPVGDASSASTADSSDPAYLAFSAAVSRSLLPVHPDSFLPSLHSPDPSSCQSPPLSYPLPAHPAYFSDSLRALGYPLDPLPQCTLLSYNLTLNLLHYVRYVQLPHNQADCSGYSHRKPTCKLGGGVSMTPRWLLWSVDTVEGGGGYADRMKGLMSTFLIALFARRAFAIDNERPLPWTDFWQPSVLPWLTLPQLDPALQHLSDPHALLQYNYMGWDAAQLDDHHVFNDWEGHPLVRMRHNGNSFPTTVNNVNMRQPLFRLGIDRTERTDLDYYLACFSQLLLKPSPALEGVLNGVMGSIGRPLYSSVRPALAAHQALSWYTSPPPPGNASIPLFCAQIRMGNGAKGRSFTDTEEFIATAQLPGILTQLHEQLAKRMPNTNKPYFLFITSDSTDYQPLVQLHFPSPPAVVISIDGAPFHIDKTDALGNDTGSVRASYLLTIASFHLLGECDMVFISRSGFGSLSQFRMRQNKALRRQMLAEKKGGADALAANSAEYSDIFIVENGGGQVVEWKHVRGGDGRGTGDAAKLSFKPADTCAAPS